MAPFLFHLYIILCVAQVQRKVEHGRQSSDQKSQPDGAVQDPARHESGEAQAILDFQE
jgi:hypothetical protein